MSEDDYGVHRNIQVQIPSANKTTAPTLVINDAVSDIDIRVPLDDVFSQVLQSYKNDPEALHRFSYYLLLQAKDFAQNENLAEDAEIVNLASEE